MYMLGLCVYVVDLMLTDVVGYVKLCDGVAIMILNMQS